MKKTSIQKTDLLPKSPTGIRGLDEITFGGLPKGRTTLIAGSAGSGKTLMGMEFLVRGATEFGENGVFMAFEETGKELIENVASLGFDLGALVDQKKIMIDHVHIDPKEIEETGEYDLEGLFIRLGYAIDTVGAKRVVLDTIESLFSGFSNPLILRAELRRLFRWLKDRNITAIITGERGDGTLPRQGLEEYVSDCVIVLDHRVVEETSTRRLRIVKYRGSMHGTNEYPFLIDDSGFSVLPITSLALTHPASTERISSGVPELDNMLGGKGFFRGSTILVSGSAGTGKSSIAVSFAEAAAKRGEKVLYFSLEESPDQIRRNMKSIGINLDQFISKDIIRFHPMRPTMSGLEMHLATMHREIEKFNPSTVVVDPINSFISGNNSLEAKSMSMRLVDYLKISQITGFFTHLSGGMSELEHNFISSLIDSWILLRDLEENGERNRGLYILKSRGMEHSNQIREFLLTGQGIRLVDVYAGIDKVLTGSSRRAREANEKAEEVRLTEAVEHLKRTLDQKRKALKARIEALQADFQAEEHETMMQIDQEKQRIENIRKASKEISDIRKSTNRNKK